MTTTPPFAILNIACDEAAVWAVRKLEQTGFQAVRTFDLQAARSAHLDCPCPHHGIEQCTCQMVVLLVYHGNRPPATMVIHGDGEASWFYLINIPQQPVMRRLEKNIQEVLNPTAFEHSATNSTQSL
jgi:hypothetical protein